MSRLPLAAALAALLSLHSATASANSDEELVADILTGVIPLGAYGIAYFKDDDQGEKQWFYSTATSLVINSALRYALSDTSWGERPNGHRYGFPSGHTSFIVSGAAFLSERYGWKYGVPAYVASAYVAHVRVDTDHHHWRDVIAAAALSWGVSHWLVTPYKDDQARLMPIISSDEVGLLWEKRF